MSMFFIVDNFKVSYCNYIQITVTLIEMSKKQDHSGFYYIFRPYMGTWMLILVHLFILFALVMLFSAIIERMGDYL
jgi:hypothetical protein